ncbi:MAG: SemiSWEET transporter [Bacteroidota bacterium]
MTFFEIAGLAAAALTTGAYVPQAFKIIRTKSTESLSLITYVMLFISCILWIVYGADRDDLPIVLANTITGVLCGIILFLKLNSMRPVNRKK